MFKIKEIRKLKKLTQTELAQLLNVSQPTVAMWESGKAVPTTDKLPNIAKALDCSIDELFCA